MWISVEWVYMNNKIFQEQDCDLIRDLAIATGLVCGLASSASASRRRRESHHGLKRKRWRKDLNWRNAISILVSFLLKESHWRLRLRSWRFQYKWTYVQSCFVTNYGFRIIIFLNKFTNDTVLTNAITKPRCDGSKSDWVFRDWLNTSVAPRQDTRLD